MVFDLLSFLIGVFLGGLTGVLGGNLYRLESLADLHERSRRLGRELAQIRNGLRSTLGEGTERGSPMSSRIDQLQKDLDEIQEEIRRMYSRRSR